MVWGFVLGSKNDSNDLEARARRPEKRETNAVAEQYVQQRICCVLTYAHRHYI